jgi:hypothetical protein
VLEFHLTLLLNQIILLLTSALRLMCTVSLLPYRYLLYTLLTTRDGSPYVPRLSFKGYQHSQIQKQSCKLSCLWRTYCTGSVTDNHKNDAFTIEASHMALSHNSFIRGFNSIYQQAERVPASDKEDFVGYCIAWYDCVSQHHHYEETDFFPSIDKATGQKGLMDTAVYQHGMKTLSLHLRAVDCSLR